MKEALEELLPRKARLVLYVLAALVLLVITAFQAAEGDWLQFAILLATSFAPILAAGNVPPPSDPTKLEVKNFSPEKLAAYVTDPGISYFLEQQGLLVGKIGVPPDDANKHPGVPTQRSEPFSDWGETKGGV